MKHALTALVIVAAVAQAPAQADGPVPGAGEATSGIWLNRHLMASGEAAIVEFIETCAERGIDVIMPNFWFHGHLLYPGSDLAPQHPDFVGWDPMAVTVREAHARGLMVWPWAEYGFFVHYNREQGDETDCGWVLEAHPGWRVENASGEIALWNEDLGVNHFMVNPAVPEAREFIASVLLDVASRYEVDGINLDRIRYMGPDWGHDEVSQAAFEADVRISHGSPSAFASWRRLVINDFMREFDARWRVDHPGLPITAAVNPPHMLEEKSQHWADWLREGTLDLAIPMIYGGEDLVRREVGLSMGFLAEGMPLWAGLDAAQGAEALATQVQMAQECGATGWAIWDEQAFVRGGFAFAP